MNILHISSANSWRGGEQQIAYLIDELYHDKHSNYLLYPFNAPIATHNKIVNECNFIPYHKRFSINPLVAQKIKSVVKQHNIDVIHAHDSHAHTFLYLSYKLFGLECPSVVSRRVDFPISKSSIKKYSHPKIKKIICVSNKINEIVSSTLGTQERITTVHSGIDLHKFHAKNKIDLRDTYNIPNSHSIIANVSAIADHKDYPTFLATAAKVLQTKKDVTFLIIGPDGGETDNVLQLIEEYDIGQNIVLTGYIQDAYSIISELDVFLFPSKMEGLGTSILDAQASGIPVVSTYAGGIPELIKHNKTGLLSKIGDSTDLASNILKLLNDTELYQRIKQSALRNVSQFSKKLTAQKTIAIYNSVK